MVKAYIPRDEFLMFEFHFGAFDGAQFGCYACPVQGPYEQITISVTEPDGHPLTQKYQFDRNYGANGGYVAVRTLR